MYSQSSDGPFVPWVEMNRLPAENKSGQDKRFMMADKYLRLISSDQKEQAEQ